MDILIHIGPHKTGTTAVQTALHKGRRALRSAGVIYPKSNCHHFAQHRLALAAKSRSLPGEAEPPCLSTELAELGTAVKRYPGHRVILSSEEFFAAPTPGIEALRDGLAGFNVKIICFLRRPDELLLSIHSQNALGAGNGFTASLDEVARKPRRASPDIDFEACLTRWASVFGWAALDVAIYERERPLPRLLSALGLPKDMLPDRPGVNRRQPEAVTDIMRLAKKNALPVGQQRELQQTAMRLFEGCPLAKMTDEQRRHIVCTLEPANHRLFQALGRKNPYKLEQLGLRDTTGDVARRAS